jgi:hypothetical protein
MQISDQLDECCVGHSEQQAHDTPRVCDIKVQIKRPVEPPNSLQSDR